MYVEMLNLGLRIHSSTAKTLKPFTFVLAPPQWTCIFDVNGVYWLEWGVMSLK